MNLNSSSNLRSSAGKKLYENNGTMNSKNENEF
jgi:hypothetical protein